MSNEEIKLPELPEADIPAQEDVAEWHPKAWTRTLVVEYARQAVIADRAARPVADDGEALAERAKEAIGQYRKGYRHGYAEGLAEIAPSTPTLSEENQALLKAAQDLAGELAVEKALNARLARQLLDAAGTPAEAPSVRELPEDIPAEFLFAFEKHCCKNPAWIRHAWREAVQLRALQGKPEAAKGGAA